MEAEPDLDTLCALLQDNDPNTTKVGSYRFGDDYDVVYYSRIGKALQGNTHVADLCIHLNCLFASSRIFREIAFDGTVDENELFLRGKECTGLILQFISSSTVLRTLSLRVEESTSDMEYHHRVAARLAGLFFQAVASSSSIEQLEINQWICMEASHESFGLMLQQTRSLRQLQIPLPETESTERHVEWLGGAFRSNSSLETLIVDSDEFESPIHCAVLKETLSSLRSHPKIQELCLRYRGEIAMETAEDLCNFLGATSTLRRLDIDYSYMTVEAMQCVIDGLRSNRGTVKMLGLPFDSILPPDACQALMTYLRSTAGESNLSDLCYRDTELDALAESMLMPDSIGSQLRHLELGFDSATFLDCLSAHGNKSTLETLHILFHNLWPRLCGAVYLLWSIFVSCGLIWYRAVFIRSTVRWSRP